MSKNLVENYLPEGGTTAFVSSVLPSRNKTLIFLIQFELAYTFWWLLDYVYLVKFNFFQCLPKKKKPTCKTKSKNMGVYIFKRLSIKN